jgi:hypothetical protein
MYDTIKLRYRCRHEPFGKINMYAFGTDSPKIVHERVKLLGAYGAEAITIRSIGNGVALTVEGSVAKFLQGMNIYGSNDLRALSELVFERVTEHLEITPSRSEREQIARGEVDARRIDFAVHSRLPSAAAVTDTIRRLKEILPFKAFDTSFYGDETAYVGQHSKRWTLKFYDKYRELLAHPLPADLPERQRLLKSAEGLLRIELTQRGQELKDLGLDRVSAWTPGTGRRLILKKLRDLGLDRDLTMVIDNSDVDQLSGGLKLTAMLHKLGVNTRALLPRSTYKAYRAELRESLDIDLDVPIRDPGHTAIGMALAEVFRPQELKSKAPKWVREAGLVLPAPL